MGKVDLPYIHSFKDRHGRMRFYYRRNGHRQRISGDPGSDDFMESYQRIHAAFGIEDTKYHPKDTFGYLVTAYYASYEFGGLAEKTKKEYKRYLDNAKNRFENIRLVGMTRKVIKAYRDSFAEKPTTANHILRVIRLLFSFAIDNDIFSENPTNGIKMLKKHTDGWKAWPEDALDIFAKESKGAARIAFYLAVYTGQRKGDILGMSWSDIQDGGINLVQNKTKAKLWIPIHPTLQQELYKAQQKYQSNQKFEGVIVQRENGDPYTLDGFSSIWDREKERLGCSGLQFHGLRKNATERLFEVGCTPQQVQSITGHASLGMVQHYGKGASQKRLATEAIKLLSVEN